jgi:hypothetical protein
LQKLQLPETTDRHTLYYIGFRRARIIFYLQKQIAELIEKSFYLCSESNEGKDV